MIEIIIYDECTDETENVHPNDGCANCKYQDADPYDYPCSECSHNFQDLWKPR